jgi:hypothetical protein
MAWVAWAQLSRSGLCVSSAWPRAGRPQLTILLAKSRITVGRTLTKTTRKFHDLPSITLRLRGRFQRAQILQLESRQNPQLLFEEELFICFFVDGVVPLFFEAVTYDPRTGTLHSSDEALESGHFEQVVVGYGYAIKGWQWPGGFLLLQPVLFREVYRPR